MLISTAMLLRIMQKLKNLLLHSKEIVEELKNFKSMIFLLY